MWNDTPYGTFRTRTLMDIWPEFNLFNSDIKASKIPQGISDESLTILYYLLYAKYGNSHIASTDEHQFKYKIYSTIFMYGPSWEKKLQIQKTLREISEDDLMRGGKAVYNQAVHDGTEPSASSLDELPYISSQNTTNYKKSKLEAYAMLYPLIATDVTDEFISRFAKFFLQMVAPEAPLFYVTDEEED